LSSVSFWLSLSTCQAEIENALRTAKLSGLAFRPLGEEFDWSVLTYQTGTLGSLFDIKRWVKSFKHFTKVTGWHLFDKAERQYLRSLHLRTIPECMGATLNECTDHAVGALLLGFPLEMAVFNVLQERQIV
jgi:hypothetical protein